jgi:hypothetical protein
MKYLAQLLERKENKLPYLLGAENPLHNALMVCASAILTRSVSLQPVQSRPNVAS